MIAWLEGTIIHRAERHLVLNVAGVGYKIWYGSEAFHTATKGAAKTNAVWIYHVIREDADDLYGFTDPEEVAFFELLIGISGIGPKTAAGILNVVSISTIRSAVASNNPDYLTKVSGIGKKNAEKIVRELQDKIGDTSQDDTSDTVKFDADVLEALKSLGYGEREIRDALKKIPAEFTKTGDRVKQALKILSAK